MQLTMTLDSSALESKDVIGDADRAYLYADRSSSGA